jgi:hypothetical protein
MKPVFLILACASFSLAAAGQISFRASESDEVLIEGGAYHTLVVDAGREHLVTRLPRGYAATVDNQAQSVVFKEDTGSIAITMRVTTNSPGQLPDDGALRTNALAIHPNENFLQMSSCATGYKPARFVDSIHSLDRFRSIRTRHAFVACPEGTVEFIFSSKDEDFDKGRVVFNLFLSSFRVEMIQEPAR